ncbi:MAG: R3H domain-containing nucleic acid-binding protein [Candidatus Paceibacterota bacterium]
MMDTHEKIEEGIRKFLERLDIIPDAIEIKPHVLHPIFSIKTKDRVLTDETLSEIIQALNHLIKGILFKEIGKEEQFLIDINSYQEKKLQDLETSALLLAERARAFKRNVELGPMNAYERMVIHSLFTKNAHIETTSVGEGRLRRVVLQYTEL